ncbi:MAG: lipase, partial [Chitinophagaceae bacterium]|nr:lipase [Chitinophagaceae bacterium]
AAGTNYSYQVIAVGAACNSTASTCVACSTLNVVTSPVTITINEAASIIPPWQREDDNLVGSIVASYTNIPIGEIIQLDIYVDGKYAAPTTIYWTVNSTTGSHQFDFNIEPTKLNPKPTNGNFIGYQLINITTKAHDDLSIQTKIIDTGWKNENYIYYNVSTESISVPLKYINNVTGAIIQFTRSGNTSNADNTDNIFTGLTGTLIQSGNHPFINISYTNSSIEKVKPGEFYYTIKYVGSSEVETGIFSLTKIGSIKNTNNGKIIIMINGYKNEAEQNAREIKSLNTTWDNSETHFSIIPYLSQFGIDAWYVGQPNTNSVKRNAYDVAKAIEKIISITAASEYFLVCHSKGGLDARALLGSTSTNHSRLNESLGNDYFVYRGSPLDGKIKKVVFLATPHKGAFLGTLGNIFIPSPATADLKPGSDIINELEITDMPLNITFANLTGFIFFTSVDGVVPIRSSEYPNLGNNRKAVQMYQNDYHFDNTLLKPFHEKIHETYNLSNNLDWTCNTTLTNKEKIKRFLLNDYLEACQRDVTKSYSFNVTGSKISGSKVNIYSNDSSKYYIGNTDENGFVNIMNMNNHYLNNKIEIEATGYDRELAILDSNFINSNKFRMALIKNNLNANLIQYPSLSILNQVNIVSQPNIQMKMTAKNVTNYLINQRKSDSIFIPLILTGNIANVLLDTGYNLLIVKFCGVDTSIQKKEIYYLPDTLMNDYAMDVLIKTSSGFLNSKMFVNNIFYKDINSLNNNTKLLRGINEIKFSKLGYKDSLFTIDSASILNLSLQPYSYSSTSDSSIIDFSNGLNPQYWKTITVKNSTSTNNFKISLKQFNDPFPNMGLIPQTRKFVFRNLNNSNAKLRTAIALDQVETPDSANTYLLTIKNGQYKKYRANQTNITEYDPEVQKLGFDSLSIDANESQEIVLMKKQAPVLKFIQLTAMRSGEIKTIPLTQLITDPDSIKNDITATIQSSNDPSVSSTVQNGNIIITCKRGFTGIIPVVLTAEHDFIKTTRPYSIIVNPPNIPVNIPFIYPSPAMDKINIEYILDKEKQETVNIYNKAGQLVKTVPNVYNGIGYRNIPVYIGNLAAGVYIVKLNNAGNITQFIKY